jgi:hypothetical protein
LQKRHHRLAYTGVVCGILLVVGLIAMNFPVFLDAYDQWGFQVKCGTGYDGDLSQAASAVGEQNYVDKCETALLLRRLWTIPLVVISAVVLLVVTLASALASVRESLVAHRDRG